MLHKWTRLTVGGAILLEFLPFNDERGSMMESYNSIKFREMGLPTWFVQDNLSYSHRGTFRGMHRQTKEPQGKLIRCLNGSIVDYWFDTNKDSPTFRTLGYHYLRGPNEALYIPPNNAHGFFSLTDSIVQYKCTTHYNKAFDGGIIFDDPDLGIMLPEPLKIISAKDANLPTLMDYLARLS